MKVGMDPAAQTSYNQVPYPSLSHASTHPDNLAVLARLLGMQPAAVEHCRVLELGCGVGGNLIPMACALPDSEWTGIDLSSRQIEDGCQKIAALGLKNIVLKEMDILDVSPEMGKFDYIIAHGVFSWVPPPVQEKILEICRHNLAPQGVAFVSYNIYPGWHMINIPRGIMRYYTRNITDPRARVAEARAILDWFAGSVETDTFGYYSYLKMYADYLTGKLDGDDPKDDAALLHDELEELNLPLYFSEFVHRAGAHGLQYLGDLERAVGKERLAGKLEHLCGDHPDLIQLEQSYDFLQNRTFRRTLLCHEEVVINRKVTPARLAGFYLTSGALPVSDSPDIAGKSIEGFRLPSNSNTFSTDHPLSKAAMLCLADAWPRPLAFEALFQAAEARLEQEKQRGETGTQTDPPASRGEDLRILAANLLKAYDYDGNLVELHTFDTLVCSQPDERPVASRWAVFQTQDPAQKWITNLRHERVQLDSFDRFLLQQLDGTRDRAALVELFMSGPLAEGALTIETEGKTLSQAEKEELLEEEINSRLAWLAKVALIINSF